MGHARALLPIPPAMQVGLAQRVAAQGLSVRETEKLANAILQARKRSDKKTSAKASSQFDPDLRRLETKMADHIGLTVEIKERAQGGEIKIKFSAAHELHNLLTKLGLDS